MQNSENKESSLEAPATSGMPGTHVDSSFKCPDTMQNSENKENSSGSPETTGRPETTGKSVDSHSDHRDIKKNSEKGDSSPGTSKTPQTPIDILLKRCKNDIEKENLKSVHSEHIIAAMINRHHRVLNNFKCTNAVNNNNVNDTEKIVPLFGSAILKSDMEKIKRACWELMQKAMQEIIPEELIHKSFNLENATCKPGMAFFMSVYERLLEVLPRSTSKVLSLAIVFSAVLQLANEHNLRLIPVDCLEDVIIRQIDTTKKK